MTAINSNTYYLSKVQNDYLSLAKKIDFACKFMQNIMDINLKRYVYAYKFSTPQEYADIYLLISNVHDDIMFTMRNEIIAIDDYFTDGSVNKDDIKLVDIHLIYNETLVKYLKTHDRAIRMLNASSHNERNKITTLKMTDNCSICCKKHGKNCAISLSCSHSFGTKCFTQWIDTCIDSNTQVSCPLCRKIGV
jgi:hypothetical protein